MLFMNKSHSHSKLSSLLTSFQLTNKKENAPPISFISKHVLKYMKKKLLLIALEAIIIKESCLLKNNKNQRKM